VQNTGAFQIQGSIVSETVGYAGIVNPELAQRVAMRDLASRSTPLSKIRLTVNRAAWNLHAGDVFRLNWTKLGLVGVVYRIGSINGGSLTDGKITIEAVEDVFGLPDNTYIAQLPSGWMPPNSEPAPIAIRSVYEVPYWDIVREIGDIGAQELQASATFYAATGVAPSSDSYNFNMHENILSAGSNGYNYVATGYFASSCLTLADLPKAHSSVIAYSNDEMMSEVAVGDYGIINGELVGVTAVNTTNGTVTVNRGVLDTVPITHAAGSRIFFPNGVAAYDTTERYSGETVDVKMTTITGKGELPITSAPYDLLTLTGRQARPYPPGRVGIIPPNNVPMYYPTHFLGELKLSWAHRDRTQQTVTLVSQNTANIGPEVNTTYTLRLYDENNTLRRTVELATDNYIWAAELQDSKITTGENDETVALLMHMDGAQGGDVFVEEGGIATSKIGSVMTDTTSKKFGTASAVFDGINDWINVDPSPLLAIGTGDFTVEFWINTTFDASGLSVYPRILAPRLSTNQSGGLQIWQVGNGAQGGIPNTIGIGSVAGASETISTITPVNDGNWHHIAFSRQGSTLRSFFDGQLRATASVSTNYSLWTTEGLRIGARADEAADFTGRIDELRIMRSAIYLESFTPPDAPFDYVTPKFRLNSRVRFELESKRNGLISHTKHDITTDRAGYGFHYGKYYGGL